MMDEVRRRIFAVEQATRTAEAARRGGHVASIRQAEDALRSARASALPVVQPGDVRSLVMCLGVQRAWAPCRLLGVGSFRALLSCRRDQFSLLVRPRSLGWGAAGAVPEQVDESVVSGVEAVMASVGYRFRQPGQDPIVRLPEAVLSRQYDPDFDASSRFDPSCSDFLDYAHPDVVLGRTGLPGEMPVVQALRCHGVYCWADLASRTIRDVRMNCSLTHGQYMTVVYEARRRGISLARSEGAAPVVMTRDVSKDYGRAGISEDVVVSRERKIDVRDAQGRIVGTIDERDEYTDRVGAEDDADPHFVTSGDQDGGEPDWWGDV